MMGDPTIDFENLCDALLVVKEKYRTGTDSPYFYSVYSLLLDNVKIGNLKGRIGIIKKYLNKMKILATCKFYYI